MPAQRFIDELNDQIAAEFAASHQYTAIAAWYEAETLPQLARFFYAQAVEERNHAMMMLKYLLDTDSTFTLRQVSEPTVSFGDHVAPIVLALDQECSVSQLISEIFAA